MKLLGKSAILLVIFLSIHLFTVNVNAHDEHSPKWFLINKEFVLQDNDIPNTSILLWAPHLAKNKYEIEEKISFEINKDELPRTSQKENIIISYRVKNIYPFEINIDGEIIKSIQVKDISIVDILKDKATLTFLSTGNYFISVLVEDLNNKVLEREDFMLIIGESVEPANLKLNNEVITSENINKRIVRSEALVFSVDNPDFEIYNYYIDTGNGDYILVNNEVEHSFKRRFLSEKMPLYIILRKENKITKVFADNYVRLYSEEPELFKVITPNVEIQESGVNYIIILVVIFIFLLGLGTTFVIYHKSKKSKSIV